MRTGVYETENEKIVIVSKLLIMVFVVLGIAFGIQSFLSPNTSRGILGVASALFLLIPVIVSRLRIQYPARLYCVLFIFLIAAYDVGCVYQGFDLLVGYDKLSHFISGIVFTIIGLCLYRFLTRSWPAPPRYELFTRCTYALFFSIFVAAAWEIAEFTGFLLTGHDSQHHLTTGVFDTMQDIICCLFGSVLSVASFALYAKKGVVLLTGWVMEEFDRACGQGRPRGGNRTYSKGKK